MMSKRGKSITDSFIELEIDMRQKIIYDECKNHYYHYISEQSKKLVSMNTSCQAETFFPREMKMSSS